MEWQALWRRHGAAGHDLAPTPDWPRQPLAALPAQPTMAGSSAGDVRRALEAALRRLERLHDPLSVQECRAAAEAAELAATTATEIRRGNVAALAG